MTKQLPTCPKWGDCPKGNRVIVDHVEMQDGTTGWHAHVCKFYSADEYMTYDFYVPSQTMLTELLRMVFRSGRNRREEM